MKYTDLFIDFHHDLKDSRKDFFIEIENRLRAPARVPLSYQSDGAHRNIRKWINFAIQ